MAKAKKTASSTAASVEKKLVRKGMSPKQAAAFARNAAKKKTAARKKSPDGRLRD